VKDRRSVWEQVKSGFRIAGLLLLVVFTFIGLSASLKYVVGGGDNARDPAVLVCGLIACAIVVFIFFTTRFWAKWLFAVLAFWFAKTFWLVVLGIFSAGMLKNTSIFQVGLWVWYVFAAAGLTFRYTKRNPVGAERLGLVAFVFCVALAPAYGGSVPLLYGLGLLGVSELGQWLVSRRKISRKQKNGFGPPLSIEGESSPDGPSEAR
jgi:hypothetical protein